MKERDEIEELFGNAFGDFEVTPPADVKVAIDDRISFGKKPKGYWYFGLSLLTMIGFLAVNIAAKVELKNLNSTETLQANFSTENYENKNTSKDDDGSIDQRGETVQKKFENSEVNGREIYKGTSEKSNVIYDKVRSKTQSSDGKTAFSQKTQNEGKLFSGVKSEKGASVKKVDKRKDNKEFLNQHQSNNEEKDTKVDNLSSLVEDKSSNSNNEISTKEPDETTGIDVVENSGNVSKDQAPTDTLNNNNLSGNEEPDNGLPIVQNKVTMGNWIQLAAGPGFGLNRLATNSSGLKIETRKPIMDASIEYNFGINERLALSTGIGFNQFEDRLTKYSTVLDSTFTGMVVDSVWNPQTMQFDSIAVASYNYFNSEQVIGNTFRFTSIEIPVFATWMINKESKYDLSVSAGIKLSYNSFKALDGDQLKDIVGLNSFGVKLMVRPQFVYHISKFGLGAYVRYSSEILPIVEYSGSKRLLQDFGAGILLRYSF